MQKKLSVGDLLNEQGNLVEAGYATSLVRKYDRKAIKAPKGRIKEWDYYYISDQRFGIALTIADNSYMAMASISVLNFKHNTQTTKSPIKWFTNGKTNLPSTSETGDVSLVGKGYSMVFKNVDGKRHLICHMDKFRGNDSFDCDITLEPTTPHSMVIATPFKKNKRFYYNQKINLLKCAGSFSVGTGSYVFKPNALGVLDWGRGVWTYKNTWYWSSFNAEYEGHNIGFNLGYGFGDTSAASENMLFYDNEVFKLDDVKFNIPLDSKGKEKYMEPWTFTSESGDIDLKFVPVFDRASDTNVLIIRSNQHQVFGKFSGTFKVEGREIKFQDLIGFAEKVYNKW